jgi:hypothetical protein
MANFDPNSIVKRDLAELRTLMVALPKARPGSAHRQLVIQLIRHLLGRVDRNLRNGNISAPFQLERTMIQDWFDSTL